MSVPQQLPSSSSGSARFPPTVYQEFVPVAMRLPRPRASRPPGFRAMRPPRFYYSRPLAPQYMARMPRYPMMPQHQFPGAMQFTPEFQPAVPRPTSQEPPKDCICERPEMMIICQRCGSELFGRIQRACPAHPKRIQLMDHNECANKFCRSIQLVEVPVRSDDKT